MIWLFDRGQEHIRLHTAYDNDAKEFVAIVTWSDGRRDQTRFDTVAAFGDWLHAFEIALEEDRFRQQGPPTVLPDGWPDKPLN
jgi:hypothetical protein